MLTFLETLYHQFYVISFFGDNFIVLVFVLSILFLYLLKIGAKSSALALLACNFSYAYSILLKYIFKQPRPSTALIESMNKVDLYSFPSSHVVFYTAFWGFLFYLTFKYVKKARLSSHVLRWLCVYFIVFVGASRIALGMHFLRDVVAGYIFGAIYLSGVIYLDKKLDKIFSKNKDKN